MNWTVGRHQIFFGAEVDRLQFNGTWLIYNGGRYTFDGQYTSNHLTGTALKLGPGLADFLLGYPSSASGAQGIPIGAFRETDAAGYFQDTWKILPKLTLNLGLRYEYYQPTHDKWGKASIYDLPTNTNHFGSWQPNNLNFGPRIGFAYALADNTVIRSGFGIYYNGEPYNFLQWMLAKLPSYTLQSVTLGVNTPVPVQSQYNEANATYNGLQSTLQYRFTGGFSLLASYTWSKSLDLADAGASIAINGLNAKGSSYGLANFNRDQVFTASYVYQLPVGAEKPLLSNLGWFSKEVIGGWQMRESPRSKVGYRWKLLRPIRQTPEGYTHKSPIGLVMVISLPAKDRFTNGFRLRVSRNRRLGG